jgi:tRNA(Ile)-lysidine synthase
VTVRRSALLAAVRRALAGLGLPGSGETIVVGLSGGPDSVALLDSLVQLSEPHGFRVAAAHLDHGLREGSDRDVAFCQELCRRLGVPLHTGKAEVRARALRERGGVEQAARRARYQFLRGIRQELGARAIAVAHTRDDQAETVLLRLLRGSGRTGLSGMRLRTADVVRPLLGVSRAEVVAHLAARGLAWLEDPSNADPRHTRNRVRHELLPYLETRFNPRVREVLARSGHLLADEAALLASLGDELYGRLSREDRDGVVLDRRGLAQAPRALARLAVRRALAAAGGLAGVAALHVERFLDLAGSKAPAIRRLPLPGRRQAEFRHREIRVCARTPRAGADAYAARTQAMSSSLAGRAS